MRNGSRSYEVVKRVFDYGVASIALVVLAMPTAVVCLIIRIDSKGSPLLRQRRVGLGGKAFDMWKLRTMYLDAERNIDAYLTEEQRRQWYLEHKVDKDPRVTRVGAVLRKTSIDEIPQILNVLKGEMSVIGPRPVTDEEMSYYGNNRDEILTVRPGMTGYWQAYARNLATWKSGSRQRMELHYVRNRSVLFDLRILLKTLAALLQLTGR